jgi:CRISPR-associated protein Csm5
MLDEKIYNCTLEIKRPVHIGCGEEFDITNFYITDIGNESYIVYFNSDKLLDKLSENEKKDLISEIKKGYLSSAFKKINSLANQHKPDGYKILISTKLKEHYNNVTQDISSNINMFIIQRTAYLINNIPYIPGSSIKGFIRTAYLNCIQDKLRDKSIKDYTRSYKGKQFYLSNKLEKDLLEGSFYKDIFSYIKISDFMPETDVKTTVLYAINFKKNSGEKAKGPYQILECINYGKFRGTIKIIKNHYNKNSIEDLKDVCNNFIERVVISKQKGKKIELEEDNNKINLIIGKYSGKEAVTIENFKEGENPTTFWKPSKDKDGDEIIDNSFGLAIIKYEEKAK